MQNCDQFLRILIRLVTACVLVLPGIQAVAQQPAPGGWTEDFKSPVLNRMEGPAANQPSTLADIRTNENNPQSVPDLPGDIRDQLGLAPHKGEPTTERSDQLPSSTPPTDSLLPSFLSNQSDQLTSPEGLTSSIKVALLLATLSLAPAIVLMTTCYVRVVVVLTLLKQAFGAQQLPPTQVLTALSLFVTLLVMTPVWNQVKTEAIDPYTQSENGISWDEAWERGVAPVKTFMANQIEAAGNGQSIALFYKYLPDHPKTAPSSPQDVPINVLLPAFLVSELKVAFLLGFQIFLPFLVLDLVVSTVTVSSGMLMLPPTMVSFPLKLILFVLVDGWNLVIGMLLQSFAPFT